MSKKKQLIILITVLMLGAVSLLLLQLRPLTYTIIGAITCILNLFVCKILISCIYHKGLMLARESKTTKHILDSIVLSKFLIIQHVRKEMTIKCFLIVFLSYLIMNMIPGFLMYVFYFFLALLTAETILSLGNIILFINGFKFYFNPTYKAVLEEYNKNR